MSKELDEKVLDYYISRCIELGKLGRKGVRKPHVGAIVLSPEQKIIGEGYRSIIKGTKLLVHAERMALNDAGERAREGYLITTLEPCIRLSKRQIFSSCCELIVERGIKKVIFGLEEDSLEMQGGRGKDYLRNNKIQVEKYEKLNHQIKEELMNMSRRLRKERPLFYQYPGLKDFTGSQNFTTS